MEVFFFFATFFDFRWPGPFMKGSFPLDSLPGDFNARARKNDVRSVQLQLRLVPEVFRFQLEFVFAIEKLVGGKAIFLLSNGGHHAGEG